MPPQKVEFVSEKHNAVLSAAEWLSKSGIQCSQGEMNGGVCAWFDLKRNDYSFFYSEITGYAVNAFLYLFHFFQHSHFLDQATKAGNWLIRVALQDDGGVKTRIVLNEIQPSYFESWTFTFDNWVVVYSFCNLFQTTGKSHYLDQATKLAQFLLNNTLRQDGLFDPVFDASLRKSLSPGHKWSRQAGSFHAKALLTLTQLYRLTKEEKYLDVAKRLASSALGFQEASGRFITQSSNKSTLLHPHLYTLEGLVHFAAVTRNPQWVEAAEKALSWVLDAQREDGSIFCFYAGGCFLPFVRVDVLAQTLRLGVILSQRNPIFFEKYRDHLKRLSTALLNYQIISGPQSGAFLYGQEENGEIHFHCNVWVTMFALQALLIYDRFVEGEAPYSFDFFV